MDLTEMQTKLAAASAELATLKAQMDAHKAAAEQMTGLRKAFGDRATLLDQPTELLAAIDAGKSYTASLVDELIKADRVAKRCGDTPEAVTAQSAMYNGLPLPALKHLHGALTSLAAAPAAATGSLAAGDPSAAKESLPAEAQKNAALEALNFG